MTECEGCRQGFDLECGVHLDQKGMPVSICAHYEPEPDPADSIGSVVDYLFILAAIVLLLVVAAGCGNSEGFSCPVPPIEEDTCDDVVPGPILPPFIINPIPIRLEVR